MRIRSQSHACSRRWWVREHPRKRVAPSCRHGLLCGAQATGALALLHACGMKTGQYSSWPQLRVRVTKPSDAVVGKLTEGTATNWASAVLYTLINGMRRQCTVEPGLTLSSQWSPRRRPSERMRLLNPHVEETGEVVEYIIFSRWKDLCLACGIQASEGRRSQVR